MLHRGIATRAFKQTFNLADHMKVTGATLEHGLLIVDLNAKCPRHSSRGGSTSPLRRGTPPSRRTTSARRVVRL